MLARRLLGPSSLAVTAVCVAVVLLARLGNAAFATALILCSLLWAFALYSVAQTVLNERAGLGRVTFPIAIVLIAAVTLVPQLAEAAENEPQFFVAPLSMTFVFISILLAVNALLRTEGKSGWPFGFSSMLAFLGIFFLPVGIWFLRPRVESLLGR
jgi:hypothetical protein